MSEHKPTDVIGLAEATALFYRSLMDDGVPAPAAIQMSMEFVRTTLQVEFIGKQEPRREWDK